MAVLKRCPIPPLLPLVIILSFLLAGCISDDPMSTFSRDGSAASLELDLFALIWWLMVAVFVVLEGVLLYVVLRYRKRPGQEDVLPVQTHGNTKLEIAWTIAPALVLVALMFPTIQGLGILSEKHGGDAINVKVIGHQWWWEFQYPDYGTNPQGQPLVVTANEMHIPAGKKVNLALESADVIHSFWVPRLAGKTDLIPNHHNTMWIDAKNPGEYYGQCAEFCGTEHGMMKLRVIADTQGEFEAWVSAQKSPQPAATGVAAQGATLFLTKGCIACHTIAGNPAAQGKIGPNLTHVGSRTTVVAGFFENNTENLTKWIQNPDSLKSGNIMGRDAPVYKVPELAMTDEDVKMLVAYMQSLK
ncbi:MAG: cytochrome c oxidase subunit II [Dehalococcoidia bacterium]|nr:cytochrome c oxidase subunit II [Dehalococcoidia bacterium]